MVDSNDILWSEIFKNRTKNKASKENKGAICLYWYLLNKLIIQGIYVKNL